MGQVQAGVLWEVKRVVSGPFPGYLLDFSGQDAAEGESTPGADQAEEDVEGDIEQSFEQAAALQQLQGLNAEG